MRNDLPPLGGLELVSILLAGAIIAVSIAEVINLIMHFMHSVFG